MRAQVPLRGPSRDGPCPSQKVSLVDSNARWCEVPPMAAGALLPPPEDGWEPQHTTSADDLVHVQRRLRQEFSEKGLDFETPPNKDDWDETMQSWPYVTGRAEKDELNVSLLIWMSMGIVIHAGRWVEAQMNYPDSLLHALLEAPGRVYYEDGGTWTRPALPPVEYINPGSSSSWLYCPHPLQFVDGVSGRTWQMLRAGDYFEAATQNPAGNIRWGTSGTS